MNLAAPSASVRLPFRLRSAGSLRTRLIFWNILMLALLLGGLGIVCRFVTLSYMMQSVDQELERGIARYLRPPPSHAFSSSPSPFGGDDPFSPAPPSFGEDPHFPSSFRGGPPPPFADGAYVSPPDFHGGPTGGPEPPAPSGDFNPYRPHLFNAEGRSITFDHSRALWDPAALARSLRGETVYSTVTVDGEPVQVVSAPRFDMVGKRGAVQYAYPLKDVYRAINGVDAALLLLVPIVLLGAGWVGSALTDRVLQRMHQMSQAAGEISAEDFSQRLPVSGADEFSELAETFNGLLGRLDRTFQEQKQMLQLQQRFTADASHELKTPLTIIKGAASLALSRTSSDARAWRAFREIDDAADRMSQLVQDLLLLARSDEGQMGGDPVELLVREVLESARSQALQKGSAPITLIIEPEALSLTGNEAELIRLFRNLLDNAVRYTPSEGRITATARASQNRIIATVEDTGVGIAPEHLPHLGERFYRVDASRTRPTGGTGLGLSICRSIAEAHCGSLTVESALGVGTTVTVILPQYRGQNVPG